MEKKLLFFVAALWFSINCVKVHAQNESDYTVPSWTLYQRALIEAEKLLVTKNYPYNVNVTLNGDPTTQMGAAWFTNENVKNGRLQVIQGNVTDVQEFETQYALGGREIAATAVDVKELNYNVAKNNLEQLAGFENNLKKSYTSNKVVINNLTPNTTYSYRVGSENNWSRIGTFTTAGADKDEFEFIYVTDTQSQYDEMFDVSKQTIEKAYSMTPDAKFLLITGDLVETAGITNSEWEWEQWFEKMQNTWARLPIVPTQGNHDTSPNCNLYYHFNTDTTYNTEQTEADARTAMNGTVYSFVYGDALFMMLNYEDYKKGETYFAALENWMETQVNANNDVKWRIVAYHKSIFTGSKSHQDDSDGKIVRERMAGVYDRLGIDLALQGHDHVYEVMGVMNYKNNNVELVPGAVTEQQITDVEVPANMTGKEGGTFDVSNGILYFLNNSAGRKKYQPRTREEMDGAVSSHGITNYFDLFNKFGQTGEPTFSKIKVSTDDIIVSTYIVKSDGEAELFDTFKVVKNNNPAVINNIDNDGLQVYPNPTNGIFTVSVPESIEDVEVYSLNGNLLLSQKNNVINLSPFSTGVYLVKVRTNDKTYTERVVKE